MTRQQSKFPTFAEVKAAALQSIDRVLAHWLPGGKLVDGKREYTAPNPTRADKHAGSLKVNMAKGTWADFATHDKGGDLIDLVRYLDDCSDTEACNRLAAFLGVMPGSAPAPAATRAPDTCASSPAPDWVPVLPIPADAMAKVFTKHRTHGAPSKVWFYRDAAGQPLMVLYRFDKPAADGERAKVFSPLTWCRPGAGDGPARWRWAGLPAPRPLLNLDKLAQQPAAPVVLCEGEKAADAAAELLPGHVSTCWPNGSKSWNKADFAPLAGRDVLLWPDADDSGQACMAAIAAHLQQIGAASVRLLALDVFQRLPVLVEGLADFAEGGQWGDGDDAADALARGWTAGHLAALQQCGELCTQLEQPAAAEPAPAPELPDEPASAAAPATRKAAKGKASTKGTGTSPRQPRTSSGDTRPDSFRVTDAGVFYHGEDGAPRLVCSRLEILARTRDERGRSWGLLVEFDDPDGEKKRLNIPASAMAGEFGREVVGPLVDLGLRLAQGRQARNCRNDLQSYLQAYDSAERARLVNRLGWHGPAYLLPDRVLGDCGEHLHFYDAGAILPAIEQAGTLQQWQQGVARYAVGNHRLAFAMSVAFAAPLLNLLGAESGGFHLYGDSSGGKTTHLRVAVSVCGSPRMLCTWRSTGNALESTAAAHCDGLLALDEIHQCDAREIGDVVYMLGNGEGKARANDRGVMAKRSLQWRLLFLSTGERTLAQHMAEAGKELKAGMEVRMIGIPTDNANGLGLFDDLHGFPDGGALAEAVNANAAKWYGTPLAVFLEELTQPNKLTGFRQMVRRFVDKFPSQTLPPDASGQARRVALRFGLVAAAGELATGMGVTGWPDGTATAGACACLSAWLGARGGVGNLEDDKIIAHLRALIELHGESRFTRWDRETPTIDEHAPRTANRLGFRRTAEYSTGLPDGRTVGVLFYVLGAVWASEIWKGYNVATVNRVLLDRGILEPDAKGGPSRAERLPTMGKTRCYVVKPEALFADSQAAGAV